MKAITANFIMACASDKNGFHPRYTPARVAMQLDRVRPIRAGRSRTRRGSETDLDEQIVRKKFALVYPAARVLIGHERHP
jgi:hypothetical protein